MNHNILIARVQAAELAHRCFYEQPFEWGRNDCAHLIATVLTALGHPDPLKGFRKYSTDAGAKRALLQKGFTKVEDVLDDSLKLERIAPAMTLPGDLVAIPGVSESQPAPDGSTMASTGDALGVVLDADRIMAFIDTGHGTTCQVGSLTAATIAWRSI